MRGRLYSFALVGLALWPAAQPRADLLPEVRDAIYSVARPDTATSPSPTDVAALQITRGALIASPRVITADMSTVALQTAITARSGKTLEPQSATVAGSDEDENPWLDRSLMLCLALGLLAYPLVREQRALRRSSKLAS